MTSQVMNRIKEKLKIWITLVIAVIPGQLHQMLLMMLTKMVLGEKF